MKKCILLACHNIKLSSVYNKGIDQRHEKSE